MPNAILIKADTPLFSGYLLKNSTKNRSEYGFSVPFKFVKFHGTITLF